MKILCVASEVAPFSKTGGLADVASALPVALAALGHEVKVVTPRYGEIKEPRLTPTGHALEVRFPYGTERGPILSLPLGPRLELLFLESAALYSRPGIYGSTWREFPDNHRRFAYLSVGALQAAQRLGFIPDILHLNDWHTALGAVALQRGFQATSLAHTRSVLTLHNLAYQGTFERRILPELGIPEELFSAEHGLEFYGQVNFLKGGLLFADALTTVSPTYAHEIQGPEQGCGLEGLLRRRRSRLTGILNGIDMQEWNPAEDPLLPARYSASNMAGKLACKRELLARFGLEPDTQAPVYAFIGRLVEQKGITLLLEALPTALNADLRVVVVGSGEPTFEMALRGLQARFPRQVGVYLGFNPSLAHLVEAGADFFLMPSRFEPCGLNQMYSLRYGTIPVVRATGGLADSVDGGLEGDGVAFEAYHPTALLAAMRRALALYADPARLNAFRRRGMERDLSWSSSARQYERLFQSLLTE